ncbi:MAG: hypothetical protein DHS20C11_23250 [Lysobacteraceae bacterium]|nr:MAG: hypothetical protein DHS20C11_23250 [Xanthomonadaceae bacterium]
MKYWWLRIFLATVGPMLVAWQLYEWVWLPYTYDLEVDKVEAELTVRSGALQQQFNGLGTGQWQQAVAAYNQTSDDLLELVQDDDQQWAELYATLVSKGESGLYVDGDTSIALIQLADNHSLLRNEVFYFDIDSSMDMILWLFVLGGMLASAACLAAVLRPMRERLAVVSRATDALLGNETAPGLLEVRGSGSVAEVERAFNGLQQRIDDATQRWQQTLSSQRDLLHAVAHEFRSPIARLRFAQDMLADVESESERANLVEKVDTAIVELDDLVREVLGYSRIRDGGYRLQRSLVDVEPLLEQVADKIRQVYSNIELVIHADDTSVPILADQRLTERAIINVIRNAARYAVRRVDIELTADSQHLEIVVNDDGPGIAPGKRDRVFEPFTRLDASRSRDSGGSGLGLAIVRAIMQQHQGAIRCEESRSGGARFVLSFPLPVSTASQSHKTLQNRKTP